ncbi:unnamed protein product [Anisakis simplex]|uniref:RNase H domain-containing protein n=1 Tax=Anisakis simplex TaxID=6269 RepID=A0A0M3J522_ANISI|nr:unnamed protein product [Anisakis simplex]
MEKFLKRKPLAPTSGKTTEKPTSNQSNHSNEREESNVKSRRSESNLLWTNVRGNIDAVNALFDVAKLSHLKVGGFEGFVINTTFCLLRLKCHRFSPRNILGDMLGICCLKFGVSLQIR